MQVRVMGDDLLQRLIDRGVDSMPGAIGAGLSVAESDGHRSIVASGVAGVLDPAQWQCGAGPLWDVLKSGQAMVLPDPDDAVPPLLRWPALAEVTGDLVGQVGGVVVTPGEWGGDLPVLFSVYLRAAADADLLGEIDRQEGLMSTTLAVVEYCSGAELRSHQMLQMVQHRRVIEQAKGLVMSALGIDAAAAFAVLSRASQHFNVPLRQLAVALVEHVCRAPAEQPDPPADPVRPQPAARRTAAMVWAALAAGHTAWAPEVD